MAIELDTSAMSPRISFSHDFCPQNIVPIQPIPSSNSLGTLDFDFCVRKSFDKESPSADELFSDGKILPAHQIKKKTIQFEGFSSSSPPQKQSSLKEKRNTDVETEEKESSNDNNSNSKSSFWRFKRSSSLNCGGSSSYGRSLCPLPLLSRSHSTGSSDSSVKRGNGNHKHLKQPFFKSSSLPSSSSPLFSSTSSQKPPLKKNYGTYNTVRVNPVLNVPSGNLFGLGSIFSSSGKDRSRRK